MRRTGVSLAILAIAAFTVACDNKAEPAATGGDSESAAPAESQPPAEAAAPVPPGQAVQPGAAPGLPAGASFPGEPLVGPIETTASGLQSSMLSEGTGAMPTAGQLVSVDYTGYLMDGSQFDSSVGGEPIQFPLGTDGIIQGWNEGIALMKVGEKRKLIIPAELAYGAGGRPGIPPNAVLVFDVELVGAQ